MNPKKTAGTLAATLVTIGSLLAGGANATVVLSFDSGSYDDPSAWSVTNGTISLAHAHDGAFGISDPNWPYSTTLGIALGVGDTLSAWFRPSNQVGGRFYLSFSADITGAHSFVAAPNTSDIRFQDNPSYDFVELDTQAVSFSHQWYLLAVTRDSASTATGRLFDSDGTTLIASLTQAGLTRTATGIGLRSFSNISIDTVTITSIPEPSTAVLLGIGSLSFALSRRRKR